MEYVYILIALIGLTNTPIEVTAFGNEEACKRAALELSKEYSFAAVKGQEKLAKAPVYICLKAPDGVE